MQLKETSHEITFEEITGLNFQQYYKEFYNKLKYYISKFGVNDIDAGSLANEAFMGGFEKIDQYNPQYEYSTWLFAIAKNLTLRHLRDTQKFVCVDYNDDDEDFLGLNNLIKFHINKKEERLEESIDYDRILNYKYKETIKEIHKLDKLYKNIMILREINNKSYEEISDILNISLQTVKNRLYHGRKKLRDTLKPKFEEYLQINTDYVKR